MPSPEISGNQALCVCVAFFYDYYHLFDLVFSLIYILVRYERRPVEANRSGANETVTPDCMVPPFTVSWMIPPTNDWLPLFHNKQCNSSISGSRSCVCPAVCHKVGSHSVLFHLLYPRGCYGSLEYLYYICRWWSRLGTEHCGSFQRLICLVENQTSFLITQLPWLCQSEESLKKNWPLSSKYFKT